MGGRRAFVVVGLVVAACAGGGPSPSALPSIPPRPSTPAATIVMPATTDHAPPAASLAVEGGDPVTGQLGTYAWRDGGSDSPWLPGARMAVGSDETLSLTLEPDVGVAVWTARYVPATADGPTGAVTLGRGTGQAAFPSPGPGAWTVEVQVVFADGLGDARYFWRLEVS